jgi:hypothetical protein
VPAELWLRIFSLLDNDEGLAYGNDAITWKSIDTVKKLSIFKAYVLFITNSF